MIPPQSQKLFRINSDLWNLLRLTLWPSIQWVLINFLQLCIPLLLLTVHPATRRRRRRHVQILRSRLGRNAQHFIYIIWQVHIPTWPGLMQRKMGNNSQSGFSPSSVPHNLHAKQVQLGKERERKVQKIDLNNGWKLPIRGRKETGIQNPEAQIKINQN